MRRRLAAFLLVPLFVISCTHLNWLRGAESEFDSGFSLFSQGRYEEAIPHFRTAVEIDPKYGKAYIYLGRSYLNLGRYLEAVPPLRSALDLSPQDSEKEIVNLIVDALMGARIQPGKLQ